MHTDEVVVPDEIPVLELVEPLRGFPDHNKFALTRVDEAGVLCALRSLHDPDLRFLVVPPGPFFGDYTPEIDDETADSLGLESVDDVLALVVVSVGDSVESATANLLAPILVNHRMRRATQVVLNDSTLPLRAPLVTA
ncbi:MAG TPA: flagellar assembly protein FliW [Nocardioidaceae bacterium]|nr:flagellar assembly protein FliW [Nocardioidaceae bacterium]